MKNGKLKLIFTIDTADKYGTIPNLFECDFGKDGNCGVSYIMDTFEKYDMRAVFFVNIYEHLRYTGKYDRYVENLIKEISERGHEVGLHSHRDMTLGFYNDELPDLSFEQQQEVIRYGVEFIEKNINKKPISFRGGGYKVNDDTFKVLRENGIKYDSSYFYGNSSNTFAKYNALNLVCKASDEVDGLIEFPIIRAVKRNGDLAKLDLNQMTYTEMVEVLEQMKKRDGF